MTAPTTGAAMEALTDLPATELVARYARGDLSPVEATDACLARIAEVDEVTNAFCFVDADGARAAALASQRRWAAGAPLGVVDGVPAAIKDLMLVTGWATRRGSLTTDAAVLDTTDSPSVAALRANGAVLVGKTTTPELGWKAVTDSPLTGVTCNPWDPARTAGGSSGGSSAAVATGMVPLATGSDGGGSIRIPAAFCGHVGLKPTQGVVPLWPATPYGTLAHHGPMTRTVADTALMLDVQATPDPRDATAQRRPEGRFVDQLEGGVAGLRVAFSPTLGGIVVEPEIAAAVAAAVDLLADLGAHVELADPDLGDALPIFETLWNVGAAQATAAWTDAQRAAMDPGLRRITEDGARRSGVEYVAAAVARGDLATRVGTFHERFDLLVTPAVGISPFGADLDVPDGWPDDRWPTWAGFSWPFNLTGQPAISVPCGRTSAGLPIGLQLVGRRHEDALVLRAAHAYEQAGPDAGRPPR
ncbi:amidase [Nitriliruptor alkaliphilus]|uniref:amidase n=1 Tax=Nitriliruptor alkaliphilus TaxID=427918 RepID=UPI000A5D591C|nr:amidase [Nitriliruptor alkaliphilus]